MPMGEGRASACDSSGACRGTVENQRSQTSTLTPTAPPWVARFPSNEASAIAALRLTPGVRACILDGQIWLRGDVLDDRIESLLRRLAPVQTFTLSGADELIPLGHLLP